MAEYQEYLAILDTDPDDHSALAALEQQLDGGGLSSPEAAGALEAARKSFRERGELEVVARLYDLEIHAAEDAGRRADLLLEQGHLYADDLLNEQGAVSCFEQVLEIRPDDESAQEVLAHLGLVRDNWEKIVQKYLDEAKISTDRQLTTSLYLAAAETFARYRPEDKEEVEQHLRKALEVDQRNQRAAAHLERLLRNQERWQELAELLEQRVDAASSKDERVQALLGLADLARGRLSRPELADECMKKVVAADPGHPRALRLLAERYEAEENWSALVMLYTNALKARRRGRRDAEVGMLLQIAMLHWKRLDNSDAAEEYFRRIRKIEPGHPAMLDFYRGYYPARGEVPKLLQVLRQALKSLPPADEAARRAMSVEIAEIAETALGNPEKAIDAWKAILRAEPDSDDARTALKRLYRKTEKWNALLDLMKDEIERLPAEDVAGRIERLGEVVEIYRDRLKLDVMVINTYNSILQLDPDNLQALDALADKYQQLGRWNDLIAVMGHKAGAAGIDAGERARLLRDIAALWIDRFGNYAQAIKPLEELLRVTPDDDAAAKRLVEIYTRRRQWRALINLLGRELERRPPEGRLDVLTEMAGLASDRLSDSRLAIELWNRVLELPGCESHEAALRALSHLYEREKRYLALAEVYERRSNNSGDDPRAAIAILERLGALYADRLDAPAQAATVYRRVLAFDRKHARAIRTLRELYAASRDYDALESLYAELEQWDDLVESLFAIADRLDDRDTKLRLLERAAAVASEHFDAPEKVARAHERVLSVEPKHLVAAQNLVPIYRKTQKWARLLTTYEILLEHAETDERRLELHLDIRKLCEEQLGSKVLAFQWTARAYELKPDDEGLIADLERLGAEADAWEEVAAILDKRVASQDIDDGEKLRLLRELGRISAVRLHRPDAARDYQRKVLELVPDDPAAMDALEEIATQQAEWPDLLRVYRRRVELEEDRAAKLDLLFKIAFLEEERVADLDAASATYRRILELEPESRRALKALVKIEEARGDYAGVADVLERELTRAVDSDSKVALLLRLGGLYELDLGKPMDALRCYKQALALGPTRPPVHAALERFLTTDGAGAELSEETRVEVASLLLPVYEQTDGAADIARVIEVLRVAAEPEAQLGYDRRLVRLYGQRLDQPEPAYGAAVRVLARRPDDHANRAELLRLAAVLDRDRDVADRLASALGDAPAGAEALDPAVQRAIATDLATVYDERLGDPDRAEAAWRRVLSLEITAAGAYDALDRIYRAAERWLDLRALLAQREQNTLDADRRKRILLAMCDLNEGVLADADAAADAYRRVLDIDPQHLPAYKALERLYEQKEAWRELEELLGHELDYVEAEEDRVELTYRRAALRARHLHDPHGALDLLDEVVAMRPDHAGGRALLEELLPNAQLRLRIAQTLEPLYTADGLWRELCDCLRVQREFAAGPLEAAELLSRVATCREDKLSDEGGAFETWIEALKIEPGDERSRRAIARLAALLDRWADAAAAYEDTAGAVEDPLLRGELLGELAEIYDRNLADTDRAMSAYQRLLEADPGNPNTVKRAAAALDRLYDEEQRWPELIDIIRRQAEWADTSDERKQLLSRAAAINEAELSDAAAAVSIWREVLTEDPDDEAALEALERLYTAGEQYTELADVLRRRAEVSEPLEDKKQLLRRVAALCEQEIGDPQQAIAAYLEILDFLPDDVDTLTELARLYRQGERYVDLIEVVERRLALAVDAVERGELTFELGTLLHEHLGRENEALERYAEVLRDSPLHHGAVYAVEELLTDEMHMVRAAEILRPIYEQTSAHDKLADLLERVAGGIDDVRERLASLRRAAEIRERDLGDAARAFEIYKRAVVVALAEPDLPEVLAQLERLAAAEEREGDLIDVYQEVAPDVLDGDLQRRLYLDVADLARAVRGDAELAREYYQRVLDVQPDDSRALNALEFIFRDGGEHDKLYDVLIRKADLAGDNLDTRAAALAEAARLCAEKLDRPDDSVVAWEQVLSIAPDSREAARELEALYQRSERWHDLTDLFERRLGFAGSIEEAVALRFQLGEIYESKLLDPDSAVENYSAALGGDPSHAGATAALERFLDDPGTRNIAADVLQPIYVSRQDWPKLARIYEIKLEAAEDPAERLKLTRYIARLYEDQLEDLEGAFRWYGRVFREDPSDTAVRDQLMRLAGVLEAWESLANVYQEYLDDESGDGPEVREVALALADIYDRRLREVERGQAAYRRVLQATPEDHITFGRLETMLTRAERWYALVDVYEEAVAATLDDRRRQELFARMAEVYEQHLHDPSRAIDAYRAILDINPASAKAAGELERLYEEQKQWFELSELLSAQIERAESAAEALRYRLKLADVLENRTDDVDGAIDQLEIAIAGEAVPDAALAALERLVIKERHRERIARILEPVYRANDWWQKLVVILDAQLEFVEDAPTRVGMLREIAQLHETRGGDENLALTALARAWQEDISDTAIYDELFALAAKLGAWDELVGILEKGIVDQYDFDVVAQVLARIAEVHEVHRSDNASAIRAWRRLLEIAEDDAVALTSLDRLLGEEESFEELVPVVQRRAELADEPEVRLVLLHRVAVIQEQELGRVADAIAAYKAVLSVEDTDAEALDALERLYRQEQDWSELTMILTRKIELAEDSDARCALRFAAAKVYDEHQGEAYEAIAQLRAVLDERPDDGEALAALDALYARESMWPELLEVVDRRAALAGGDREARAELMFRAAQLVRSDLLEPESAIGRYADVLEIAPGHAGARGALDAMTGEEDTLDAASEVLEELYRREAAHDELAALYERRLEAANPDPTVRREQYRSLAEVHELSRNDAAAAFAVWARALAEAPEDAELLGQLERLAAARGSWKELAQVFEERLDAVMDAELEYGYAVRLGQLYEEAMGDLDRAADKYRRALGAAPADERGVLEALARIYERAGKFAELAEVLARQADATLDEAEQAEFLFRLGDVREQALGDLDQAVTAYRDVLERVPQHSAARGALERLLAGEAQEAEIIGILEPLYESEGDFARLADLLVTKLRVTEDHIDRASIYARVAEIAEQQLSDPVRALDAAGGWLAEDPQSEQALAELERLAEAVGRWAEVAARLSGIVSSSDTDDVKLTLLAKMGQVQLDRLGDDAAAETTFRQVLDMEPESAEALESLERIYRSRNDAAALAEILARRGELAFDAARKRALYAEVAELRETLGDVDAAIAAHKQVLEVDEGDRQTHARLAAIYENRGDWRELIDTLELSSRFAGGPREEAALKSRVAQIYTDTLGELDAAVDAWQAVLDVEPDALHALVALEAVQARRGDWLAVQEVLSRRLDMAESDADRIVIFQRMAEVAEKERESTDEAVSFLHQILDIDNAHFDTYAELERLLQAGERWHDLVELFQREAEVHAVLGRGDQEIFNLARAADVWEGPLENPDAAGEILEQILRRDPNYVPALTRLAKIYEGAGEWGRCGEILQRALSLGPTGRDAADLHFRLGEVNNKQAGDVDAALGHYGQALRFDPGHLPSITAIEGIAREREDWPVVADMVTRREAVTTDPAEKLELTLEMADLYGKKLGQPDAVIPLLEQAAQLAPEDPRVIGPLADIYFAARRYDEAAPIYERLASEAKRSRKMKEVAKYRQRLGGIFEATGDIDRALAAYEEAFRVNPTDVATMAGLGRIYVSREVWDKARRVYRSLVLQNVDPSMGITKAEVYYNLGNIHIKLGEPQKAKGMFQRGLELEPNNPALREALDSVR